MLVNMRFNGIENVWLIFWRSPAVAYSHCENELSNQKFFDLCKVTEIVEFVKQSSYKFYQFCIEVLIPDVMAQLPANLIHSIRSFAKNIENWLLNALVNAPCEIKEALLLIMNKFSMCLKRYTSLNHLVQTVRNSLQNETIFMQMLNDISKVDFGYIKVNTETLFFILYKLNFGVYGLTVPEEI